MCTNPSYARLLLGALVILVSIAMHPTQATAHGVYNSYMIEGSMITGEVGFSSQDLVPNAPVEVKNADGDILLEIRTDDNGVFAFQAKWTESLFIEIDLGSGHIAKIHIPFKEFASALPSTSMQNAASVSMTPEELETLVESSIARHVKSLRKDIAAFKEEKNFQSIVGGIGYIFGLFGLFFFVKARRDLKQSDK